MGWYCKFLKTMKSVKHRSTPNGAGSIMFSNFSELEKQGYSYITGNVDFGKEFELTLPDKTIVISWSYTARDGIYVKVMRLSPYKVLYGYLDGVSIINDSSLIIYINMVHLTKTLDDIRDKINDNALNDSFEALNKAVMHFAIILNNILHE